MDDGRSQSVRVELRGDIDREVAEVLDAVASARRVSRAELVAGILGKWAAMRKHEATVIGRVTRGNPPAADGSGKGGGSD